MRILIFFLLLLAYSGCKKETSCELCLKTSAVVTYTGPVSSDGCEWNLIIGGDKFYYPDNLPEAFKEEQLRVEITYTMTDDKFYCGIAGIGMPVIHLNSIKK